MEHDPQSEWSNRLKAFGMILKLGEDLFAAPDFATACGMAVNSPRALLQFKRAAMLELSGGRARVVAQYAQVAVNRNSDVATLQSSLCERLDLSETPLTLSAADAPDLDPEAGDALSRLLGERERMMIFRLEPPPFLGSVGFRLVWMLEFVDEIPKYAANAAGILARNYGAALYSHRCCRVSARTRLRRALRPRRVALYAAAALLAALMFLRVQESANAEFEVRPPRTVSAYAWFDGPIARCYKQDGDRVEKGELVAEYDAAQLAFRLANAESQAREIEKELDLERSAAFSDRTRLGRVQLIEARLNGARVAVEEAKWYMAHAKLTAPESGTLALADGRAELLTNRAVRTGDRIFDVYAGDGAVAEILVNERDSSILQGTPEVTLFLYTRPEAAIPGRVLAAGNYPELTEQRVYCYRVRAAMEGAGTLRYGMRGIAKLRGERVALGYYLFKNLVIHLRRI